MKRSFFIIIVLTTIMLLAQSTFAQEIFDAVRKGDLVKVKELVEKDTKLVNAKNFLSATPLHIAAEVDHAEIAKYLIEKGADVHALNSYLLTPLNDSGLQVARILVDNGADVNFITPNGGASALFTNLELRRKETAEYLLDKGAKLQKPESRREYSEFMLALRIGSIKIVNQHLQQRKEILFESNPDKNNALHVAVQSNSMELVIKLLNLGVPIRDKNIYDWTLLHQAASSGSLSVLPLLIEKGLDVNARTIDGKTPYNLAIEADKKDVADYLVAQGADQSPQKYPVLTGDYFGQQKPGGKAVRWLILGRISSPMIFTPDGNVTYWSNSGPRQLWFSKRINGTWTAPAPFPSAPKGGYPFITPDGNRLFYLAERNDGSTFNNIYVMNKIQIGWSKPIPLGDAINSINGIIRQLSVDAKGNLYFGVSKGFGNYRIYCSEYKDGKYCTPELFKPLDEVNAYDPYVSPDGSYLIYFKPAESAGLWIIFKKKDGTWTSGKNIGEILGFPYAYSAVVTPDGKYAIFLAGSSQYWIDAVFIKEMRKKELQES